MKLFYGTIQGEVHAFSSKKERDNLSNTINADALSREVIEEVRRDFFKLQEHNKKIEEQERLDDDDPDYCPD